MLVKTSISHPLRIDVVQPIETPGKIGMTLCPGKHQQNALSGVWQRDLTLDIESIKQTGAALVITLMEQHELYSLGVENIGKELKKSGLDWYHLPIVDRCAPDKSFKLLWQKLGKKIHQHLKKGDLIVLHCMGGLGRTGTVAAQLLIELGESNDSAIMRIRQARPGAIETQAQEIYIKNLCPITD